MACWRTVPFLCSAFSKSSRVSNSTKQPFALPVSRWRRTNTSFTCAHGWRHCAAPRHPAAVNTARTCSHLQLRVEDGGHGLGIGLERDVADVDLEGRVAGQRPGRHRRPRQAASRVRGSLARCSWQRRQPIHCRPSETSQSCNARRRDTSTVGSSTTGGRRTVAVVQIIIRPAVGLAALWLQEFCDMQLLTFLGLAAGRRRRLTCTTNREMKVVTAPTATSAHQRSDAVPCAPSPPEAMMGEVTILPV